MDDMIYRKDAIEVADAVWSVTGDKNVAKVWAQIQDLPSVQPEVLACGEGELIAQPDPDTASRKAVLDAMNTITKWAVLDRNGYHVGVGMKYRDVKETVKNLPPAQPKKRTEERTETRACDLISREAAIDT